MGTKQHAPTRAAVRFSHFVRQMSERGVEQQELAKAIGRSGSLISKLQRVETSGRTGLTDLTIQGLVDAYNLSSDFLFLSDEQIAKRFGDRAKVVALPDGTTRPVQPGEVDAQLFSLQLQREVANERRIVSLEKQVGDLTTLLRQALPHLVPPRAKGQ
jgi:hypothetical protein